MRLGELTLDQPVFIAPMAGVTDKPFREICFEQGGDAAVTEMISAKALYYGNRGTETLLRRGENERLLAVQLFGRDPEIMADMALTLEDRFDWIDVNMGCPMPKIVNNGEGSALMKEPELADAYAVKADAAVEELRSTVSGNVATVTGDYVSVELSDGQTVTCKAGTEVLFRAGSANAAADLSDVTDGSQLEAGQALATNHLYLTRMDGGAVTASGGAALMIRGEYTIG